MVVQREFNSQFGPGDKVVVGGEISGVVERVCFARNMTCPMILVEWWDRSEVNTRYFHEDEVHHSDEETGNGYATDTEMANALGDLERRIASTSRISVVRIQSSKGV